MSMRDCSAGQRLENWLRSAFFLCCREIEFVWHLAGITLRWAVKPKVGCKRRRPMPRAVLLFWPAPSLCFPQPCVIYMLHGKTHMAYIIAEPCIGTKDTACVDACPVDCIHPKKDEPNFATAEMLYIDPVECIDCGACVPVCPVSAIFALDDLPEKWKDFTPKNAAYYGK